MKKLKTIGRPRGRNPVLAVRLAPPLHEEIVEDARRAQRTLAAEVESMLRQAFIHRKRFPTSAAAHAMEAVTFNFLMNGERYARDNGVKGPWTDDLESRRQAALAGCQALLAFVTSDLQQQAMTVESLKGRVWTQIVAPGGGKWIPVTPGGAS
jgi:hypothetical protein